jgi:Flp pilus assembly protein TadD
VATWFAAGRLLAAAAIGLLLAAAPASAAGQLAIDSRPSGASVWLNGRVAGATPLVLDAPAGTYQVQVRMSGREARSFSARVVDGLTTKRSVRLGPAAAAPGELRVTTRPAGATLYLDGRALGASPIYVHGLSAGRYRLSASWPDGRTASRTVVVHAGLTSSTALGAPPVAKPAAPRRPEAPPVAERPRPPQPAAEPERPKQAPRAVAAAQPAPAPAAAQPMPPATPRPVEPAPAAPVVEPEAPTPAIAGSSSAPWPLPSFQELLFGALMAALLAVVGGHLARRRRHPADEAAPAWYPARPARGVMAWHGEGAPDEASASAIAAMADGRWHEGADAIWTALSTQLGSAWHYYHVGLALHQAGRLQEAENAYRTAIQIAPDWEASHFNLAVALEAMGQRPQAVIAYRQLLEAHPTHADALFNLGHLYHGLRMHHQAIVHWQAARKLAPKDAAVRQNLKLLKRIARTEAARRPKRPPMQERRAG